MKSARETLSFAKGTVIDGRYEIDSFLGEGGMGSVYLAKQRMLNRLVAIKFVPLAIVPGRVDPEVLFRQEAELQAKLKYIHIVEVYDGGVFEKRDNDRFPIGYIAMEYVNGGSLRQRMRGDVSLIEAISYVMQLARALAFMHNAGIVHRDVKPENTLVSDGVVKITDAGNARFFGTSKYVKYKTSNPHAVGTVHYMPHEQLLNTGMDETVDTFALSVMAFELIAGRHPRAPEGRRLPTREEVMGPLLKKLPMPDLASVVHNVPAYVTELVQRGLSQSPEERPSAQDMATVFRTFFSELGEEVAAASALGGASGGAADPKVKSAAPADDTAPDPKPRRRRLGDDTQEADMERVIQETEKVAAKRDAPPAIAHTERLPPDALAALVRTTQNDTPPPVSKNTTRKAAAITPKAPVGRKGASRPAPRDWTGPAVFVLCFLVVSAVGLGVIVMEQKKARDRAAQQPLTTIAEQPVATQSTPSSVPGVGLAAPPGPQQSVTAAAPSASASSSSAASAKGSR